jgi:cytochrome b561
MATRRPKGYSGTQIALHWAIAGLVLFQLFGNDGISDAWRAAERGETASPETLRFASFHVWAGLLILALMLWRLWLRLRRGVPALPEGEPGPAKLAAEIVHWAFYAVLILAPLAGAAAWFGGIEEAADLHENVKYVLAVLIGLHFSGVLVQFFVFRSDVPARMLIADEERG